MEIITKELDERKNTKVASQKEKEVKTYVYQALQLRKTNTKENPVQVLEPSFLDVVAYH